MENITNNVVEALKFTTHGKEELIKKLLPKLLQNFSRNFAATEGTSMFNKFSTQEFNYKFYILMK